MTAPTPQPNADEANDNATGGYPQPTTVSEEQTKPITEEPKKPTVEEVKKKSGGFFKKLSKFVDGMLGNDNDDVL
jgi:hypothetical protein